MRFMACACERCYADSARDGSPACGMGNAARTVAGTGARRVLQEKFVCAQRGAVAAAVVPFSPRSRRRSHPFARLPYDAAARCHVSKWS